MKSDECKIGIGDVCLAVTSDYPGFCEHFRSYYGNGLIDTQPDCSVFIYVQDRMRREDISRPLQAYRGERPFIGERFSLYGGMISGCMDLPAGQCELWVELALIASEYLPLFQDLLFRDLFHHIRRAKSGCGSARQYIVHGCAVVRDLDGFLFLGPSGSGKSTIAALSTGHAILHDEDVLLAEENGGYWIQSTPYASGIPNILTVPLKGRNRINHTKLSSHKSPKKSFQYKA